MSENTEQTKPLLDKTDWLSFWCCFGASLIAYWWTMARTVTLEDAGELVVAADYLGVPHPPGYPIWTLFAWFFQWIFGWVKYQGFPNPAWGVAFMSVFFGALSVGITGMLISRSGKDILNSLENPQRSLIDQFVYPSAGFAIAFIIGFGFRISYTTGVAIILALSAYLVISFSLNYFNEKKYPFLLPGERLGPIFFGFIIGLVMICSLWTGNKQALIFSISMLVIIIAGDLILGAAQKSEYKIADKQKNVLRLGAAFSASLFFAFTPVMWSQSVIVEVYSLNSFFMAIILLLTYLWIQQPSNDKLLYITAALFGLGLTNHQSLLFLLLFLLAVIALVDKKLFKDAFAVILGVSAIILFVKAKQYSAGSETTAIDLKAQRFFTLAGLFLLVLTGLMAFLKGRLFSQWKKLIGIALIIVFGLSFYAYMPFASEQNPPMNWAYPRTVKGFKHSIGRGQFEKISLKDNISKIEMQLKGVDKNGRKIEAPEEGYDQRRFFFFSQLGVFFYNPDKDALFSMTRQFTVPMMMIGLLPFLLMGRLGVLSRGWVTSTAIALFSLTLLFLVAQYPQLNYQDLFIKRVQYIQAHGVYSVWIGYGLLILSFTLITLCRLAKLAVPLALLASIGFPFIPLHMNATDEHYINIAGCAERNGHNFGWEFGRYQLEGAPAIMDELKEGEEPLPNLDYPPPMDKDAIFFGGTDPGRFVPTYMIYSANCRPDVYLITQNALADNTYMNIMRDLYGEDIWLPSIEDSNNAFTKFYDDVKTGRINTGADVSSEGGKMSVQGVGGVMSINGTLSKNMHDKNKFKHSFYIEESYAIPWMFDYLQPHGLSLKLNAEPVTFSKELIKNDMEFWDWYSKRLLKNPKFKRDAIARKTFSKLRSAIGGLYDHHGHLKQAEIAHRQSIDLYPLSPEATSKLTSLYVKQYRFDDAEKLLNEFLELDPNHKAVKKMLSNISRFKSLNKKKEAIEAKQRKGIISISDVFTLLSAYYSLKDLKSFDQLAVNVIRNNKQPIPPKHMLQLSVAMERFKKLDFASEAVDKVIEKNPNDFGVHIQRAGIYVKQEKYQEAIKSLQTSVKIGKEKSKKMILADSRFEIFKRNPAFQNMLKSEKAPELDFKSQGLNKPLFK